MIAGKIFLLIGPPGVGKGTHAQLLAHRYGVIHISTGDLFRAEAKSGSERGRKLAEYMAAGQYVPPDMANPILTERLGQQDCQENAVLLDGFPRTRPQLDDLDQILAPLHKSLHAALFLDLIDAEESVRRISGRRTCSNGDCKAIYNIHSSPPTLPDVCDRCASPLIQRADDKEETIRKRFARDQEGAPTLIAEVAARDILFTFKGSSSQISRITDKVTEVMCFPDRFTVSCVTAFHRLSVLLNTPPFHPQALSLSPLPPGDLADIVRDFRDASLRENAGKRTGSLRRWVYLATTNTQKTREFVRVFDRYGVEVLQIPPLPTPDIIQAFLLLKTADLIPVAVLSETSLLLKPGSRELSSLRPGVKADHLSTLCAWTMTPKGVFSCKEYSHVTRGRLRARVDGWVGKEVFGWDDRFELDATGKTYQEHLEEGLKISSRDMVLSQFLADRIYYKSLKTLNHMRLDLKRPVDFDVDVATFVQSESHYNTPIAVDYGFRSMLHHVLNEGIFYKAASTRIEANYWQPGLNAGIPLIAKADPIHERTFMIHDFGHFMMKDLIFTGRDTPLHRSVYIIQRLISEAVTIMCADGVFVNSMDRSGVRYDFTTRHIYPLFQGTGLDFSEKSTFLENLRAITKASVDYTVKGDDTAFRHLLAANHHSCDVLEAYQKKFKPFFVSDYQWTVHNYDHMVSKASEMRRWWEVTRPLRDLLDLPLETIDDFITFLPCHEDAESLYPDYRTLVDQVFDVVFERRIKPVFSKTTDLLPFEVRQRRGFLRWIIGQSGIFARFESVPGTMDHFKKLVDLVRDGAPIAAVRQCYEEYVHSLTLKNLISKDDDYNYCEIYPLFEPFYVSYDKNEEYPELAPMAEKFLDWKSQRSAMIHHSQQILHRTLTPFETRTQTTMQSLVIFGDGQVEDGLFVTNPGVLLVSHSVPSPSSTLPPSHLSATFLISGVAVETSMELVAHWEAAVARLTTSKTQAMSAPLYRIQDACGHSTKRYIESVLNVRHAFESRENPLQRWGDNAVELWNMTNPGNKTTTLLYTMKLSDFHTLCLGRLTSSGNELEVQEVVSRMLAQLKTIWPSFFMSREDYIRQGNGAKSAPISIPDISLPSDATIEEVALVSDTIVTPRARILFRELHIDMTQSPSHQLAEFRSRITYLSFPTVSSSSVQYMQRMVFEYGHLSVLDAHRIGVSIPSAYVDNLLFTSTLRNRGDLTAASPERTVVTLSVKGWHRLLIQLTASPQYSPLVPLLRKVLSQSCEFALPRVN